MTGFEAVRVATSEVALRWIPGTGEIGRYWLAYARGEAPPATCAPGASLLDVTGAEATVFGLDPDTTYAFRLCPVDDRSGSLTIDAGVTTTSKTLQLPPGEVSDVTVVQSGPGAFSVSWLPATGAAGYVVAIAEGQVAPANCFASNVTTLLGTATQLTNLATNRTYAVRVCAKNANPTPDLSPGLTKLAFMNSPLAPNPTSVTTTALDAEWMRLSWTGNASEYRVAIGTSLPPANCTSATESSARTNLVLTNLAPSTMYFVRVCPSNGDSQPLYSDGAVLNVRTTARVEPRVNGLRCTQGGSLTLHWTGTGPGFNYLFTKINANNGASAPLCTNNNTTSLNTGQQNGPNFSSSVFGGFANERYHLRVCFIKPDGTGFDQGQSTHVIMPQIIGNVFINGSCDPQENLVRPAMTMSASSAVVQDRVALTGTCTIVGSTIAIGGDATGTATCESNNRWSTSATVTTLGDGPIRIAASPLNSNRYQGSATFLSVTKMCESSTTTCGDGVVDAGEECDLGCGNGNDRACTKTCMNAVCGDGFIGPNEQCDLGANNSNTGACTLACRNQACGDGYLGPNEQCDLGAGNSASGTCTPVCTTQRCGDGFVGTQEQCDDGANNSSPTGTCTPVCMTQTCGDGYRGAGEQCDGGSDNGPNGFCLTGCVLSQCGDGLVNPIEDCDDGNTNDGDACPANCGVDRDEIRQRISAGFAHNCGIRTDGTAACAGYAEYSQGTPNGVFASVMARGGYTCGLRPTGEVLCWGQHFGNPSAPTPPSGTFTSFPGTCGIRTNGAIGCIQGEATPPLGVFRQIAGSGGGCGVRDDYNIVCWGDVWPKPSGAGTTFTQVSVNGSHACGLRTNGSMVCWSDLIFQDRPGPYVQVATGWGHVCAMTATGAIECFGSNTFGQSTPPAGDYVTVDAFDEHTCAIKVDGTMDCWGSYSDAPTGTFLP